MTIWNKLTLEHTRQDGDDSKAPWYAYPTLAVLMVGLYALVMTLDAVGF